MLKEFSDQEVMNVVEAAVETHGRQPDAFIPILLEVNRACGYVPAQAFRQAQKMLHQPAQQMLVSEGRLYSLASFYEMLATEKPGRHVILFCESAPCHIQGGRQAWQAIQQTLGLRVGETDPVGRFTLKTVSCLGLCALGPLMLVDEDVYTDLTPEKLAGIFGKYE